MCKLSRLEQETIIIFNEAEDAAEVATYNKSIINRLQGYIDEGEEGITMRRQNSDGGCTFVLPKKWVMNGIRRPKRVNMTPEQRAAAAERLKMARMAATK